MKKKTVALLLVVTMLVSSGYAPLTNSFEKKDRTKKEKSESEALSDKVLTDLPTSWDLTELYEDEDAFEADMERIEELLPEAEKLRGTLNSKEGILATLESPAFLEINTILNKASMYVELLAALDPTDSLAGRVGARYNEVMQELQLATAFEEPEIMELSLKERKEIFSDPDLKPYAYAMRNYTDPDYVVLSEEAKRVESILLSAHNNSATHDIFDYVELERPEFTYPDGKKGKLTDTVYSNIAQSGEYDHEFRKEVYGLRNAMRQPYANTYASLLDGEMRKNWAEAQINGFDSSLEAALKTCDVEPEIYDRVIEFAHSLLPKVYEYYEVRKEVLGLDEMMVCDLNVPVSDYESKKVSYEDAVNRGRSAITVWGDEYLEAFDRIITKPHIDVYPSDTKDTGAFEELRGNETTPFVLYNFDDSEDYISTIVHEMGHAVYSEFSAENQNLYNCEPTIFTQEVASTANELMLSKAMIADSRTKDEKLFWLDKEINLFVSTILRQCMYSEFEDYCYKTIEKGGKLDADEMSDKWMELQELYYGDAVTCYEDSGIDWARIPHLYYDYYVYKYACALTYAASICNRTDKEGQKAIDDYIDFLKAGNSDSPSKLLGIAGVDPLDDATYEEAAELIGDLIDEFREMSGTGAKASRND